MYKEGRLVAALRSSHREDVGMRTLSDEASNNRVLRRHGGERGTGRERCCSTMRGVQGG